MKVKCINNEYCSFNITIDQIYEVIETTEEYYYIVDNTNIVDYYFKYRFVSYLKELRTERLKTILTNLS